MKIVYATEVDSNTVRLNFVSYPRERMSEGLELLKEKMGKYFIAV